MKTKAQKQELVRKGSEGVKRSQTLIVADFTGFPTKDLNALRRAVRAMGGVFAVVKKRLLGFMLREGGIEFDAKSLKGQAGVVFSPKDLLETAGAVYRFGKGKETFKILGGFDVSGKRFVEAADVIRFGALPSHEVLLSQLVSVIAAPLRQFLFILDQKSKQTVEK